MNEEKLDLIIKEQQEMKKEQLGMKQDQQDMRSQMNSRFDTVETKLSLVEEKVDGLDRKVDTVQEQVAINTENIVVMQADISQLKDMQETVVTAIQNIAAVQERQEKTIDLLARRSIDHEAELKRIK